MTWILLISFLINLPVAKINFEGNHSIKTRELSQVILSQKNAPFSDFNIIQDVNRIIRFYYSRGFFDTKVEPVIKESNENIEIVFKILEGNRPRIREIRFLNGEKKLDRFLEVEKNEFYIQEKIKRSADQMETYYKDIGYAFARVNTRSIPDSGILIFEIQKDNIYYINGVSIKGLKFCNPSVVRHEIEIKSGDIYSKKKILNSQLRIYRLGFFSTVDVDMIKISEDKLDLVFNLRELKSRILNWGIGISIPLSFIISVGLEEMNLFNIGHRFKIQPSFKINIKKEWEAKIDCIYAIPYLTGLRLSPSILPFYWYENKEDFNRKSWGAEFRISKLFTENIQANIANKYKYVDIDMKTQLPDTFSGTTNSIKFQLMGDYRNEFFNPSSGIYFVPVLEYAGGILGGSNHYIRFETETRYYKNLLLGKKNIIAQRLKFGIIIPTDGVSLDEKYYLGGQYSLRGYPEKSIGPDSLQDEHYGEVLFNFNIEDRLTIFKSLGIVVFLDMGYLDNRDQVFRSEFFKISTGLGIRYYTPIGPIRADFGIPLKEKGREFYLGIYHIF
uniref:POTRA domain-containing protein n=1 Tax=candidate division WOR-3 bacterium TaxID=2052148 RepID=A0A7C6EM19_UNCW3